jgi:PKD repeat protein
MAFAAAVLGLTMSAAVAPVASADVGFEGKAYPAGSGGSPTGSKPESKAWYAGGRWWAVMAEPLSGDHHIFGLDRTTHEWIDTGVAADTRNVRDDALWDEDTGKLYIASHTYSAGEKTGGAEVAAASAGRIYRYSFDAAGGTWSLDGGFPRTMNSARSETLVIDRDSTGTLWATWLQIDPVSQEHRVYVNRSGDQGVTWTTPAPLPGAPAATGDDVSSVIPFGGNRVGVMYSSEATGAMKTYFAVHTDGAADDAWAIEEVPTGYDSDDHINLKADAAGRVYAVVKTSNTSGSAPLVILMVRGTDGGWTSHVVGTYSDSHTRPIVELDEGAGRIDVFATHGQSGGTIVRKSARIGAPDFAAGTGEIVMQDDDAPKLNDATSTKQNVGAASGLVVLANNNTTSRYWHAEIAGDGSIPAPTAPTPDFTGTPTSGQAPLTVAFRDASTGSPSTWSWSFGDGATASAASPSHTYTAPGTYSVTLTVRNAGGSKAKTRAGYVVVRAPAQAPEPPPASPPAQTATTGGTVAGVERRTSTPTRTQKPATGTTAAKAPALRVTMRRLSRDRVRLTGTLAADVRSSRVAVQVRTRSGRWITVHPAVRWSSHARPRFTVVVKRRTLASRWRLVLTSTDAAGTSRRSPSRTVVVPRRALRRAT